MSDAEINPLGPPIAMTPGPVNVTVQIPPPTIVSNAYPANYAVNAKMATDAALIGRITQCMINQSRLLLENARAANINPSDLALAHEIATGSGSSITPNKHMTAVTALVAADSSLALAYTYGPQGNQQAGITDDQILALVKYFWHPISTS